jgi:hypothetical protein
MAKTRDKSISFRDDDIPEGIAFYFYTFWDIYEYEVGITYKTLYYYQQMVDIVFEKWERDILFELSSAVSGWLGNKQSEKYKK